MKSRRWPALPVAEGIGVLLGVLAWDWLSDGRASLLRALLFAIPCGLALYVLRCLLCLRQPDKEIASKHDHRQL